MKKIALVYTPKEIDAEVLAWLTDGYHGEIDKVISFLKHVAALKQAIAMHADCAVIVEYGAVLDPEFQKKINLVIPKIPDKYNICLLSHYVTSWDGLNFVEGTDNMFCTISNKVHGSYGYWIRLNHVEHLLALYDQPLRNIPQFSLGAETISRMGQVCMLYKPIIARLDDENFKNYFGTYGFQ